MANLIIKTITGLNTFRNEIDTAEYGDLQLATNVVIDKTNTITPRRGFVLQTTLESKEIRSMYEFKNNILSNTRDNLLYYRNEENNFVQILGTLNPPEAGEKVRGIEGGNSILFTTDLGIKKLEALNAPLTLAGLREAYEPTVSLDQNDDGFMAPDSQVSYRVTYTYIDDYNRLHESAPSTRVTISNSSETLNQIVNLEVLRPRDSYATGFRVYRTDLSLGATLTPANNFKLALSGELDQTNDIINISDNTPQIELGVSLYTNNNSLTANNPPPKAKVLATFQGSTVYGDVQNRETFFNFKKGYRCGFSDLSRSFIH